MVRVINLRDNPADLMHGIEEAVESLRNGRLVIFPTDTVPGIAVRADNPDAVSILFLAKHRPANKPLAYLVSGKKCFSDPGYGRIDEKMRKAAEALAERFWPGALTIVVPGRAAHSQVYSAEEETLGFRMPGNTVALEIIKKSEFPIYVTSANISGGNDPKDASMMQFVSLVLESGDAPPADPSTVLELKHAKGGGLALLQRAGAVSAEDISAVLSNYGFPPVRKRKKIVFICTGNTCRSPMAEYFCKDMISKRDNVAEPFLAGYDIESCGTSASDGVPPFNNTLETMNAYGIDISGHLSRGIRKNEVIDADRIFVMTEAHREQVCRIVPEICGKTELLDPDGENIADPYGGNMEIYRTSAKHIKDSLERRLEEL